MQLKEKKEAEDRENKYIEKQLEKARQNPQSKEARKIKAELQKKTPKSTNFVEKERDIHEAYQLILNEYYRRVKKRQKAMEAASHVFSKVHKASNASNDIVTIKLNVSDDKEQG